MTSVDSDPMQKVVRALKGIKRTKNNAVGNKSMALITSPHSFNIQPPQEQDQSQIMRSSADALPNAPSPTNDTESRSTRRGRQRDHRNGNRERPQNRQSQIEEQKGVRRRRDRGPNESVVNSSIDNSILNPNLEAVAGFHNLPLVHEQNIVRNTNDKVCALCYDKFVFMLKKHHNCAKCGISVCDECSKHKLKLSQ